MHNSKEKTNLFAESEKFRSIIRYIDEKRVLPLIYSGILFVLFVFAHFVSHISGALTVETTQIITFQWPPLSFVFNNKPHYFIFVTVVVLICLYLSKVVFQIYVYILYVKSIMNIAYKSYNEYGDNIENRIIFNNLIDLNYTLTDNLSHFKTNYNFKYTYRVRGFILITLVMFWMTILFFSLLFIVPLKSDALKIISSDCHRSLDSAYFDWNFRLLSDDNSLYRFIQKSFSKTVEVSDDPVFFDINSIIKFENEKSDLIKKQEDKKYSNDSLAYRLKQKIENKKEKNFLIEDLFKNKDNKELEIVKASFLSMLSSTYPLFTRLFLSKNAHFTINNKMDKFRIYIDDNPTVAYNYRKRNYRNIKYENKKLIEIFFPTYKLWGDKITCNSYGLLYSDYGLMYHVMAINGFALGSLMMMITYILWLCQRLIIDQYIPNRTYIFYPNAKIIISKMIALAICLSVFNEKFHDSVTVNNLIDSIGIQERIYLLGFLLFFFSLYYDMSELYDSLCLILHNSDSFMLKNFSLYL